MTVHQSRNTMFWRRDENVARASKHPNWARFHRECGKAGLFFDDIDPVKDDGKDVTRLPRAGYRAVTFRLERRPAGYDVSHVVSHGYGPDPIAAVIDAYFKAEENGFPVPEGLDSLFASEPVAAAPPVDDDILGLIG